MTRLSRRGSAPSPTPQVRISPATALEPPSAGRIVHSVAANLRARHGFPCWYNRVRGGPVRAEASWCLSSMIAGLAAINIPKMLAGQALDPAWVWGEGTEGPAFGDPVMHHFWSRNLPAGLLRCHFMLFKAETTEVTPIVGSSISSRGPGRAVAAAAAEPVQGAPGTLAWPAGMEQGRIRPRQLGRVIAPCFHAHDEQSPVANRSWSHTKQDSLCFHLPVHKVLHGSSHQDGHLGD